MDMQHNAVNERRSLPRWRVLRSYVDGFDTRSLVSYIVEGVENEAKLLLGNHNINSLALFERDRRVRSFFDLCDFVVIDGMPVVALARLCGGRARRDNRVAVLDWFWPFCKEAELRGWQVLHLGATSSVLDAARVAIAGEYPKLNLSVVDGYFDMDCEEENAAVLEQIRVANPDVLLVGMGMPRQEQWILENYAALPACIVLTVGGILGYIGGDRPTPPRWLGSAGMEWGFRLVTEPERLWARYLVEPLVLLGPIVREIRRALS